MSSSASENTLNLAQPEPTLQKNEWYLIAASDEEFQATETSLRRFWKDLPREIATQAREVRDFKQHNDFPLARIKRIMKSDEDVRMIRAEAPILLAKACELFIHELTIRSLCLAEKGPGVAMKLYSETHHGQVTERFNLTRHDVEKAVTHTATFDYLIDALREKEEKKVQRESGKNEKKGAKKGGKGKGK